METMDDIETECRLSFRSLKVTLDVRSLKVKLDANALASCHCHLKINRKAQHKNLVCVSLWVLVFNSVSQCNNLHRRLVRE